MRTKINLIFTCLTIAVLLSACFKNEEYPIEPNISDPVFTVVADSANLRFNFTDGDGDIGLAPDEMDPPYDTSSYYHYNLYIEYFEKDDELGWVPGENLLGEPVVYEYRIKPIVVKGKAKALKGTIDIWMQDFHSTFSSNADTVKYAVKLIDRALHESNVIETEPVYLD